MTAVDRTRAEGKGAAPRSSLVTDERKRLSILLRAGADIQLAQSEKAAIRIVADAAHASGWGAIAVNLFDEHWNVVCEAYAGMPAHRIAELQSRRVDPNERRRIFGPERDQYQISRSYFVPADVSKDVVVTHSVMPGARPPQPGDTWNPLDIAYTPLRDSSSRIIGRITYDDPDDGQRPDETTFAYLESFADLAARTIETLRLIEHQHRFRDAVLKSEADLRLLHDHIPDLLILLDTDLRIRWVNRIPEGMALSYEQVQGQSLLSFIAPEDRDRVASCIRQAVETGRTQECDAASLIAGDRRYWQKRFVPILRGGRVDQVLEITNDITQAREQKIAQRENETRLELAMSASKLALWDWDVRNDRIVTDTRWFRMFGYEPGSFELDSNRWKGLVHEDDWQGMSESLRAHLKGEADEFETELRVRTDDGAWRWIYVLGGIVERGADGRALRLTGTNRDVTEEREAKRMLAITQNVVETGTDPIYWCDQTGRILYANRAACEALGYSHDEVMNFSVSDFIVNTSEQIWNAELAQLEAEGSHLVENLIRRKDGSIYHVECNAHLVSFGGQRIISVFVRDITERKKAEEFLVNIAEGVSGGTGDSFFRHFTRRLAELVNADIAWVGELVGSDCSNIRSLAGFQSGKELEPIEYALAGTPCQETVGARLCCIADGVAQRFPEDAYLQREGIRGYVGVALVDLAGQVRGIASLLFRRAIDPSAVPFAALEIFASRGAAELERQRTEDAIRATNARQQLLLRELNHRTKNVFGSLLSLIDLHAGREQSVDVFAASIRSRVKAMADVHALLSATKWTSLSIAQIARSVVPQSYHGRLSLVGPNILFTPRQSTPLAIVLQEFMSNALKYGAFSVEGGRVDLSWERSGESDAHRSGVEITVRWIEIGGPPVASDPNAGLGTSLIHGFAQSELRGGADLRFDPEGVDHRVKIVLDVEPAPDIDSSVDVR